MYEVEVEISFPASHQVHLSGAEPEAVHEHNWRVRAKLGGEKLSPDGILVDFILVKQILAEIVIDVERVAQEIADAINNAQAGAIIDQREEQVRDAHAEFRQKTYQKAISLLGKNQQAFSPSPESARTEMEK